MHAIGSFAGSVVIGSLAHAIVVYATHGVTVFQRVMVRPRLRPIERTYAPHMQWLNSD